MKWLALSDTKITDCGLKYLVELRDLQTLLLSDTQITDAGIKHLKELKNLTSLDLDCTEISDGGLIELQNALPYCKIKGNQPYGMERLRKNQLSRRDKENKQQITREEAIQELRRRHKERQCL